MLTPYYNDALKLAQKEFRRCTAAGEYPYLSVLDEILSPEKLAGGVDLGLVSVPMEFIVGTRTAGRTNAFARNFMPLMEPESEFADKWQRLCLAHLEEGIRDPVKVYEYLNRYYVEEGNKRVSVLRFFGAESVEALVTRIMPDPREGREAEQYLEFVEFYRVSRINYVEFTKPGGYAHLQQLLGKSVNEVWTDEDRQDFHAAWFFFRRAYEANGGARLRSTVGDALLAYLDVYGYQQLRTCGEAELKKSLARVWEEIVLLQEPDPIDVKLDPEAERPEGLLAKVLPKAEKPMKAAFIHDKDPALSGWTYGHELGREHVQRIFGGQIETAAYFNALDADAGAVIEQAIADGCSVIFTTSPRLLPASLRAAVAHPKTVIFNCALNMSHRYIRTYYARMYEAKFIAGVIAGALAGSDNVGYICDYPIFGQVAGINAFALGVQTVDPRATVYLEWSSVGGVEAATKRLTDRGVRLVSSQDLARLRDRGRSTFGLSLLDGDSQVNLAMPVWQWGVYYEALLRRIRDKSLQSEYTGSNKALNYYWGMSAGVVEMRYSDKLPTATRKLAGLIEKSIRAGLCDPFRGPLYDQAGHLVVGKDKTLPTEQVIDMSWLNENVSGAIPAYEDLSETGKATVGVAGVSMMMPGSAGQEADK